MTRTLIVYYSRTGTARRAAEMLQQMNGWPVAELCDVHVRSGWLGDMRCVFESMFFRAPRYYLSGADADGAERLVLVAPIWMGQLASPMRAFLRDRFKGTRVATPKVSLVCVMGQKGGFNAAAEVARIVGKPPVPMLALSQAEVLDGSCREALQSLTASLDVEQASFRPAWLSPEAS